MSLDSLCPRGVRAKRILKKAREQFLFLPATLNVLNLRYVYRVDQTFRNAKLHISLKLLCGQYHLLTMNESGSIIVI